MERKRVTNQKKFLEEAIKQFKGLFTGEEVWNRVRTRNEKIGIATVYRFLKEKKKARELHTHICDRRIYFSRNKISHGHFKCEKCGKTREFSINSLNDINGKVSGEICCIHIDVSGICEKCRVRK